MRFDHLLSKLNEVFCLRANLKSDPKSFALPGAVDRQHDVGKLRRRRFVEFAVNVKFECLQSLASTLHVGMGDQNVRPERHQRAYRVGLAIQNSAITLFAVTQPWLGGPIGCLSMPSAFAACSGASKFSGLMRLIGCRFQRNVAAGSVEITGQCIESAMARSVCVA